MKNLQKSIITILITAVTIVLFSSCEDDCITEPCDTCDIPIEIMDDETNVIVRFRVPDGYKQDTLIFSGTLYEYLESRNAETVYFTHETGIAGNIRRFLLKSAGEPVLGAEVFVEQEPNDEPITSVTTGKGGVFKIPMVKLEPGTYSVRVGAQSDKGGFAVAGYRHE